jgi:hypothetical protein
MKCIPVILGSVLVTISSGLLAASGTDPSLVSEHEQLADGNVRDPVPDSRLIAQLVSKTKKNFIALPGGTFEMGD